MSVLIILISIIFVFLIISIPFMFVYEDIKTTCSWSTIKGQKYIKRALFFEFIATIIAPILPLWILKFFIFRYFNLEEIGLIGSSMDIDLILISLYSMPKIVALPIIATCTTTLLWQYYIKKYRIY